MVNSTNKIVIDNAQYEAEIYFIKDPCAEAGIIPMPFSAIEYLEITNDLANLGYCGKIVVSNFNDILEQLGILKASKKTPLLYFRLKCLEFPDRDSTYDDIFFVAALTQGQDIKEDEIKGSSAYNFEELFTFNLKTTRFLERDNEDTLELAGETLPWNEILEEVLRIFQFRREKQGTRISDPNVLIGFLNAGTSVEDESSLNKLITLKSSTTYYDVIDQLSKFISYKANNLEGRNDLSDWYDPGVMKIENYIDADPKTPQRQIVVYPLLSTVNKFFTQLSRSKPTRGDGINERIVVPGGSELGGTRSVDIQSKYFNNFLTEKFNISQRNTTPTFSNNTITKYELNRINLSDVLGHKWIGVNGMGSKGNANECDVREVREYDDIRTKFEEMCTFPYKCNLPESNNDEIGVIEYNRPGLPVNLTFAYGTNSVFKSFVFDNVKMVFRVKGQTYRKPNRFISINPPASDKTLKPLSKESAEVNGYWYVLSVNHVFINGDYFNDFECVKLYNLGGIDELDTPASQLQTPPTNDNTPVNTDGTINGSNESNENFLRILDQTTRGNLNLP